MTSPQGPIATSGEGPGSFPVPPVPVVGTRPAQVSLVVRCTSHC
jgi:hypothetical protein